MTNTEIHKLAKATGLTTDLICAYEYGVENGRVICGTWIEAIDDENMDLLRRICKSVPGNYSMIGLAMLIIKGGVVC